MRWSFIVLSCLAVMACDSKQVGSSDGTQSQGGHSGETHVGSPSHAAEGGSPAGRNAAAGGRNSGAATAPNQVDAGTPTAGGMGGKDAQGGSAGAGGKAGEGGNAAQGGQGGQGGKAGAGGKAGQGGSFGGAGAAAGSGGAGTGAIGKRCGTRGGVMCAAAEFCNFEPDKDCGATDRGGKCEATPTDCDDEAKPVCGCDHHTYDNACDAHMAGVSVQREDMCGSEDCDAAGGTIVTSDGASIPKCPAMEPSFPIRGGREQTICCLRATRTGQTCGGIASLECGGNEFCNYEKSAGGQGCDGQIADAGGVCQARPSACTREYIPVCGCDHHSYGNACVAHSNGAGVMHEGECTIAECKAVGGRVEVGAGPGPMCKANERDFGSVAPEGNQIPIEGQICCVP